MPTTPSLADQLLDAQVAWLVDQLTGDRLDELVARDVDELLEIGASMRLDSLVDPAQVRTVARRLVATAPASTAARELVTAVTDVVLSGPQEPFAPADVVDRAHVEAIVDQLLGATHLIEGVLDELAQSPLVATAASRFMGRIVGEVLQANRAVAEKVPGLGSLMSFGTGAASRVMGAADKQFEQLIGGTAGKGATFAVRRLNRIVLETLRDPTTREAVLQVWDQHAGTPIGSPGDHVRSEDVHRFVGVIHDAVAEAAPVPPVAALVDSVVDAFFDVYGAYPVTTLLDELDVSRDDLVGDAQALAGTLLGAAHEAGHFEPLVRARLEPFFRSEAARQILG